MGYYWRWAGYVGEWKELATLPHNAMAQNNASLTRYYFDARFKLQYQTCLLSHERSDFIKPETHFLPLFIAAKVPQMNTG